jgi:predicted MFS family arabinose efflux permease
LLAKVFSDSIDTAMTVTVTIMGIANVIGNFLVGAITDLFKNIFATRLGTEMGLRLGYRMGYLFIGVCCMICYLGTMVLFKMLKKQNKLV